MESATGSTNAIAFCGILQRLVWGFTSKSVEYVVPQPFAKRIKNLNPYQIHLFIALQLIKRTLIKQSTSICILNTVKAVETSGVIILYLCDVIILRVHC